jgi:transcriptional regulator with XRE-family HTH domain
MTKLRAWRMERNWTLNEISGLSGYSIGMLSRAERGQRELSAEAKVTIARRLGADVRDLFDVPATDRAHAA